MESMQRATFYASDFHRYGADFKNSAYLQNPKAYNQPSKRGTSNNTKTGKVMNRRLKSGHSNNRTNLSVYTSSHNFVDPIYSNQKKKNGGVGRAKSIKNKESEGSKTKPFTAQQEKRHSNLDEQGSNGSIKDSIIATLKQTIANDEANDNRDNSFTSEKPASKAVLPAVDHAKSKRKIDDLMFNPSENSKLNLDSGKNISLHGMQHKDMNGPETNLNEMPDLTTFDNRDSTAFNKLINNKAKGKEGIPTKSTTNLKQQDQEVLPIYKRRAYNRGPVRLMDNTYYNRPLHTNYSGSQNNAWVRDPTSIAGDENINGLNQRKPIKGKPVRTGRQPTDFRINKAKTNPKMRNRTAVGKRNPIKPAITS